MGTQSGYNPPVLFLIYNRPELTRAVWSEIVSLKPLKLYIAADGPKNDGDRIFCEETRRITENITWECTIKRLYRNHNLGCRVAVSEALTWFFNAEEEGVILEDDCLPNISFFYFCKEMLEYYRNDHTVGHISGTNHHKITYKPVNSSFFFSKYPHIWGWATWKRVWENYDQYLDEHGFSSLKFNSYMEKIYWWDKFRNTRLLKINSWDYQYLHLLWKKNLRTVMPVHNMIKNIGFNSKATHFSAFNYKIKRFTKRTREEIDILTYPLDQEINVDADKILFRRIYNRFFISNSYLICKYYMIVLFRPFLLNKIKALENIYYNTGRILYRMNFLLKGRRRYPVVKSS